MESSKLKLNPPKTDVIIIGTKQQRHMVISHFPVKLLGSDTFPPDTVHNLDVVFDKDFNFHQHIYQVCSRLDYCNSQLNNIAKRDLAKLQRVHNCLARVVGRAPRFSSSLPLLIQLHWLPVTYRINFKLSTLTYRDLFSQQPPCLTCLLYLSNIPRQLRHNNLLCLKQNLTWAKVLSLSLRLGSGMNSPSRSRHLKVFFGR